MLSTTTVDANHALGFDTDERVFLPAARILDALGITRLRLITNNPDKISQLEQCGIKVEERVPLVLASNPHNEDYLATKKHRTETIHHRRDTNVGSHRDQKRHQRQRQARKLLARIRPKPFLHNRFGMPRASGK